MRHVLFYDHGCPLCNRSVRFVLSADRRASFLFAPLQGETAKRELMALRLKNPDLDTLVLLQDYQGEKQQQLIEGRGAFRILWLLGGKYRWVGWLSFLPSILFDLCYRLVARYRYRLFATRAPVIIPSERFLP